MLSNPLEYGPIVDLILTNNIGSITKQGYRRVYHPITKKQVPAHRIVYEYYHKCSLLKFTDVHHINNDKLDNRIKNLLALTRGQHTTISCARPDLFINYFCILFKKYRTTSCWHRFDNSNYICHNCYKKERRKKIRLAKQ